MSTTSTCVRLDRFRTLGGFVLWLLLPTSRLPESHFLHKSVALYLPDSSWLRGTLLFLTVFLTSHPTYDPSSWGDPNLDCLSQENLVA